ncbi:GntR family transcriptional regulator [Leekyejoonella antrihumi]|uniref:GntR family transcriptional regulator n=1 Tax=Leekyejoonella antrihumi TaxID=1660198 RepID=A0A563DZ06_9MICO|nr:GntR family transcriptional regulator [Leekyejoonella antrihumi]TWP35435.1 GntR family transcriptional regulator [Leekyejoonella antrihumi]
MTRTRSTFIDLLQRPQGYTSGPEVVDELRRVVASGAVPPGSTIPLDEVAEFFQLSRIPVREALKTLVGEGLLEHQPRLGYTVTSLSSEELNELYLVRGALEAAALDVAVRRATERDDRRVQEAHDRLTHAVSEGDTGEFQRSSRAFHEAMLQPCRMPRLLHMLDVAWNITEPVQTMVHVSDNDRSGMHHEHAALLDAYLARDAETLHTLAAEHHQHLMRSLTALGD